MSNEKRESDAFVSEIRRQAERARRARHLTFWQGVALVGSVGWMVALPAVGGAVAGHWLDHCRDGGLFWTLSLLSAGLLIGCASAWRHVEKELKG
jgi:ATP synthase protein I